MAESAGSTPTSPTSSSDKSAGFSKVIQRRYSRTVEKMMQSFGRTDKTTDVDFEQMAEVFTEQQNIALRLHSELKNYMKQARTLSTCSASMQQAIKDAYDQKWFDADRFTEATEKLADKWNSYMSKLEEAQANLMLYVERFQDLKQKISKRSRKMTDYDSARHTVQSLEGSKKRDSFKINKAQDEMVAAKLVYEALNKELRRELEELHASRVQRVCAYLNKLYEAEASFLEESASIKRQLANAAAAASTAAGEFRSRPSADNVYVDDDQQQSSHYKQEVVNGPSQSLDDNVNRRNDYYETVEVRESTSRNEKVASQISTNSASSASHERNVDEVAVISSSTADATAAGAAVKAINGMDAHSKASPTNARVQSLDSADSSDSEALRESVKQQESIGSDDYGTVNRSNANERKTYPYKVVAVYDYEATDSDELTLRAGDVITVIEFDDPEDQDPGWLMGIKESDGQRGIVPENFTKRF